MVKFAIFAELLTLRIQYMYNYDVVLLTDSRYVNPRERNQYVQNVLEEDGLVIDALEKEGFKVGRTNWDNPHHDWSRTGFALFRTTWDYFKRYPEFSEWLEKVSRLTRLVNPIQTIRWNIDKHYLLDLHMSGIEIPSTIFIEPGDRRTLNEIILETGWKELILKPSISGGARHTYRLNPGNINKHEPIFRKLIRSESLLIQEFQHQVIEKGEVAYMLFGGHYSHAVLKKAKSGDFRVQDDFGGSVENYQATGEEIAFAEKTVSICDPVPVYARVDAICGNSGKLCVSELELIEPELWFRKYPPAAKLLAGAFTQHRDEIK